MKPRELLSFSTTATLRPELLNKTYSSFKKNLREINLKELTLYLNIDPVPVERKSLTQDVIDISKIYFGNVIVNTPDSPNFSSAVKWCWSRASSKFLFHLEDDWTLTKKIAFKDLISLMKHKKVFQVALRAYDYKYKYLCLSPSLIKYEAYKHFASTLSEKINPELQIHVSSKYTHRHVRVFPKNIIIKDIGRKWISKFNLMKPRKPDFIGWVEKPKDSTQEIIYPDETSN